MICDKRVGLYETRIKKFVKRIGESVVRDHIALEGIMGHSLEPVPFGERLDLDYEPAREGDKWGDVWDSAWFHLKGVVPAGWAGKKVVAQLDFSGEGLVFGTDGKVIQGITNGSIFSRNAARDIVDLYEPASGGEEVELWVEAAANGLGGARLTPEGPRDTPKRCGSFNAAIQKMRLCVFDKNLWHFWLDLSVLEGLMQGIEERSVRRARILKGLSDCIDVYRDDTANTAAAREVLAPLLAMHANASAITATSVGHAHIDTGWLWPVRETIRKCGRTFGSQLALIDECPEYIFGASQAQHYQFTKEHYPDVYERIKKAVSEGRWEIQGGMWVEADCNIISGESMVRQFLHGKNFFKDEFGFDVKNTWIPDVFGYSAAMPQIMKRAGCDYFLTQKLSWSQFNQFPHHTFMWRGIDGTEVLTHFPPENTYNSALSPNSLCNAEKRYAQRGILDEMMVLFGTGDGGGGAKREFIENGRRQRDLEGSPKVKFGRADEFFERVSGKAAELPLWDGELYLELHRGTLTTQGRTKRGNRKLELALRETEYLCSMLPLSEYPREKLDGLWKSLLINQFHDILPGSSIGWVYEDTEREHAESIAECGEIASAAAKALFTEAPDSAVVVNTLSKPYSGALALPEGWRGATSDGAPLPSQTEADGTCMVSVDVPSQGIVTLARSEDAAAAELNDALVLENDLVRYEFNKNGQLTSAFDKEQNWDALAEGQLGNVLSLYEDRPNAWDAWDVDIHYESMLLETASAADVTIIAKGPVRQAIRFELNIGESKVVQEVSLAAGSKRLDFHTEAEWHERHRMLRTSFPVDIETREAAFDIQYGYARRPTHRNTSWDMARFEVAAQKYADLSDRARGVALLNDCKYGHKILDNVIDLNLLRSSTHPDACADQGRHEFTYSLLPHCGTLVESNVQAEAAALNQPPLVFNGVEASSREIPCKVAGDGVSLEVLKKAEKDECLVIRLVETLGKRATAAIEVAADGAQIVETDLMEWNDIGEVTDGRVSMRPFDIRTFKIKT